MLSPRAPTVCAAPHSHLRLPVGAVCWLCFGGGGGCAPQTVVGFGGGDDTSCSWLIHRLAQPSSFVPGVMFAFNDAGCIILWKD